MLKRQMVTYKPSIVYSSGLIQPMRDTVEKILTEWKNKDVVKPQDLAMSWYFTFLHHEFTQESALDLGA